MRAYVISILFNNLFVFGCIFFNIFFKTLIRYFKVFGSISRQTLIKAKTTEKKPS